MFWVIMTVVREKTPTPMAHKSKGGGKGKKKGKRERPPTFLVYHSQKTKKTTSINLLRH